jgi:hypothetical protein
MMDCHGPIVFVTALLQSGGASHSGNRETSEYHTRNQGQMPSVRQDQFLTQLSVTEKL